MAAGWVVGAGTLEGWVEGTRTLLTQCVARIGGNAVGRLGYWTLTSFWIFGWVHRGSWAARSRRPTRSSTWHSLDRLIEVALWIARCRRCEADAVYAGQAMPAFLSSAANDYPHGSSEYDTSASAARDAELDVERGDFWRALR